MVRVPEGVNLDHAAFTTLGAIAMQGVRQAEVRVGEKVAVIGLGLVGLLTVQILRAAGCRVFGIDVALGKIALGHTLGCAGSALANDEFLDEQILAFTSGYGVDATIVTAASSSSKPVEQAAEITREKGRVVVVGLTGMELPREPFYLKELDLRLSRSYGPGRYDKHYEDEGVDYPFAYVRFTERRNMGSFLELVEAEQVRLDPLISHRFAIDDAVRAYDLLHGKAKEPYLGILLQYSRKLADIPSRIELRPRPIGKDKLVIGVIGAGNYASANLLPHLRDNPAVLLGTVCTGSGFTAERTGRKAGFAAADSDVGAVIRESDAVVIATRHHEHAELMIKAVLAGKPVFVEKPLAITEEQLARVRQAIGRNYRATGPQIADDTPQVAANNTESPESRSDSLQRSPPAISVGFNRRFAPATTLVLKHFKDVPGARQVSIRVNAGAIPTDHWTQDPLVGGGRLIGEGCHFVDLAVVLTGSTIKSVSGIAVPLPGKDTVLWDTFSIALAMANGSIATVVYGSGGDTGLAKERIEVHAAGRSAVIDDFRSVDLWNGGKKKVKASNGQDKGQRAEMEAWINGIRNGQPSIPLEQIFNVHDACFAALRSIASGGALIRI